MRMSLYRSQRCHGFIIVSTIVILFVVCNLFEVVNSLTFPGNNNSHHKRNHDLQQQQQQQQQQRFQPSSPLKGRLATLVSSKALFSKQQKRFTRMSGGALKASSNDNDNNNDDDKNDAVVSSKRSMLGFAIPALGIFLMNPLLSNIDNMFVGRTTGTLGLAALSPATICTDQMIYLCSFLPRATTGIVSACTDDEQRRDAACTPLAASICVGMFLTLLYVLFTPSMLRALHVRPQLHPQASSYIYIRGAIAWAALFQSSALSVLLATKDAWTPLKILSISAALNVVGDYLLCVAPFRFGCAGASAATAGTTVVSSFLLLQTLRRKKLLVFPDFFRKAFTSGKQKWLELFTYTGPLLAITITRLAGFLVMQQTAMSLGVTQLAGYQLCVNMLLFFLLFGEPLSQLSQTNLPSLLPLGTSSTSSNHDSKQKNDLQKTLKSIVVLASGTSIAVAMVAFLMVYFGSPLFSSDVAVLAITRQTAPSIFLAVATAIFTVALDGAMLASRDFGFMFSCGISTFIMQLFLLPRAKNLSHIFTTFTLRLGLYSIAVMIRTKLFKKGLLGRALQKEQDQTSS